jgi:endonuclease/exonuclease/phosphatase family metal-dependent hydrolase
MTTFASVHLDSHGSPENRAAEMRALLDAIDAYDRDAPVVIGGDLNAFSLGLATIGDAARVAEALRADPQRWSHPVPHEPLFAVAEARGFTWSSCNAYGVSTLRHATETGSTRGVMKLDWFLCRGIAASGPRVVDAIGPASRRMLSDHEAIAVSLHR